MEYKKLNIRMPKELWEQVKKQSTYLGMNLGAYVNMSCWEQIKQNSVIEICEKMKNDSNNMGNF